ncbi:MAG: glycosyltransferase family 9 protein [Bacteroidia bacterium]|nr:glycosyltransferase family 9 protein [Bacteroidia bacterium]MCX7763684.1 glycosyltransferase family 9 protein [Bacteroidia bacterium]MDW8057035.1 glycosyltransferase family 9 protein [Bacteroidia bacterium]
MKPIASADVASAENVLMVCTGLLGDSVMTVPFLRQFREAFPTAKITMLSRPIQKALFSPLGYIDEFIIHSTGIPFPTSYRSLKEWQGIRRGIKALRPQAGVILLGGEWLPLIAQLAIPIRIDSVRSRFPRLVTHMYEFSDARFLSPQVFLGILKLFDITPREETPHLRVVPEVLERMQSELKKVGVKEFILFSPLSATPNRSLSPQRFRDHIKEISKIGLPIIVVGADKVSKTFGVLEYPLLHDWSGRTSVEELMALVALSRVVVTMDTGTLHLAGALNVPTVGLFRRIRPEYATLYPSVVPLFWEGGESCLLGCSWDSWYGCRSIPCRQIEGIEPQRVRESVENLLMQLRSDS